MWKKETMKCIFSVVKKEKKAIALTVFCAEFYPLLLVDRVSRLSPSASPQFLTLPPSQSFRAESQSGSRVRFQVI